MQYRWQRGEKKSVQQYLRQFADYFTAPEDLSELSREEFACERQTDRTYHTRRMRDNS